MGETESDEVDRVDVLCGSEAPRAVEDLADRAEAVEPGGLP